MRRWLSLAILLSLALACGPKLTWAIYTTDDGLAGNEVRDLFVDAQGRIWAGTWGGPEGGASVFAGENWTPFTVDEGLAHKDVNAVFVDHEGTAWFATERGLSLFDGSAWTTYTEEDGLADDGSTRISFPFPDSTKLLQRITSPRGILSAARRSVKRVALGHASSSPSDTRSRPAVPSRRPRLDLQCAAQWASLTS